MAIKKIELYSSLWANCGDLLDSAHEHLMRQFASEFDKSKGQFCTSTEDSRIFAKVIGFNNQIRQNKKVYLKRVDEEFLKVREKI